MVYQTRIDETQLQEDTVPTPIESTGATEDCSWKIQRWYSPERINPGDTTPEIGKKVDATAGTPTIKVAAKEILINLGLMKLQVQNGTS